MQVLKLSSRARLRAENERWRKASFPLFDPISRSRDVTSVPARRRSWCGNLRAARSRSASRPSTARLRLRQRRSPRGLARKGAGEGETSQRTCVESQSKDDVGIIAVVRDCRTLNLLEKDGRIHGPVALYVVPVYFWRLSRLWRCFPLRWGPPKSADPIFRSTLALFPFRQFGFKRAGDLWNPLGRGPWHPQPGLWARPPSSTSSHFMDSTRLGSGKRKSPLHLNLCLGIAFDQTPLALCVVRGLF